MARKIEQQQLAVGLDVQNQSVGAHMVGRCEHPHG